MVYLGFFVLALYLFEVSLLGKFQVIAPYNLVFVIFAQTVQFFVHYHPLVQNLAILADYAVLHVRLFLNVTQPPFPDVVP